MNLGYADGLSKLQYFLDIGKSSTWERVFGCVDVCIFGAGVPFFSIVGLAE